MKSKPKILFLCTGNSCRSQMGEGWARQLHGDKYEVYSAGIEAHGMNPLAVQAMKDNAVDISGHTSKTVKKLENVVFDYVITVCGHADENCPVFPGDAKVVHKGFEDPPKLAQNAKTDAEKLVYYKEVSEQIRDFVKTLPQFLSAL